MERNRVISRLRIAACSPSFNRMPRSPAINRTFRELTDKETRDPRRLSYLGRGSSSSTFGWEELLKSWRILIVSEAGAGKTHECRARRDILWDAGEPAFYFDLATLVGTPVREMLSAQEEERFDAWLKAQSDVVDYFLDSIDELKLSLGSIELALKRLEKSLFGQLGRAPYCDNHASHSYRPPIDRTTCRYLKFARPKQRPIRSWTSPWVVSAPSQNRG
jgi:hypothetical protein